LSQKSTKEKNWKRDSRFCRMNTCFDFNRCFNPNEGTSNGLKIHLYPNPNSLSTHLSESYLKILNFIKNSDFYETDPKKGIRYSIIDSLVSNLLISIHHSLSIHHHF